MVCPHKEWMFRALQPVPPFFQCKLHSKQLLVANIIVALSSCQSSSIYLNNKL